MYVIRARCAVLLLAPAVAAVFASSTVWAQDAGAAQSPAATSQSTPGAAPPPATREAEIELARRQKHATLWPERENPLVARANRLVDRGFFEGIKNGEGNNGWQMLLTGTRPNQGQTVGIGYRRSDLLHDFLTARGTVRGTRHGAFLLDGEAQINSLRRSKDTYINLYANYEHSPRMEFYGLGGSSLKENRTGYVLDTGQVETRAGYRFTRQFDGGFELGYGHAHTGPVTRDDIPSIETKFDATTAPGLFDDAQFVTWGAFAGFDTRDLPSGPKSGGFYGVNISRYNDLDGDRYTHNQLELEGQQFLPYFNQTRVIALFIKARFAYTGRTDRVVPFYLQPKLGGNFDLRGFNPFRFYDNNAFVAAVEHRWYAFSGLEMALFMDTGTTVPTKGHIAADDLNYSGGIGLRGRLRGAIVLRTDVARSREGWRWIWSMSDISRRRF